MLLVTDTCKVQTGRVILQKQLEDSTKTFGYSSPFLSDAENQYDTTQRECLAVAWAVLLVQTYLKGHRFTIYTDHSALIWIPNFADSTGRLA